LLAGDLFQGPLIFGETFCATSGTTFGGRSNASTMMRIRAFSVSSSAKSFRLTNTLAPKSFVAYERPRTVSWLSLNVATMAAVTG
jgi:hypothetical protein